MKPAQKNPLGVEDAETGVACIVTPDGVEMIELATGRVLWHLDEQLIPLALDNERALLRRPDREPYVLKLELRDRRDGHLIARVAPASLPFNAELGSLAVFVDDDSFVVQWNAPGGYRGAAPPSAFAAEAAPAAGALRVDVAGEVSEAPLGLAAEEASQPSREVLSMTNGVLRAHDATTGDVLWERTIAKSARRAPPLRP